MSFAKDHPLNNEQEDIINLQEYKEISTLYHKVRAGKDPDTKQLHITEEEFTQQILHLIEKREAVLLSHIAYMGGIYEGMTGEKNGYLLKNCPEYATLTKIRKRYSDELR